MESVPPTLYIGREQGMKLIYDREAAGKPKKWPMIHLLESAEPEGIPAG